MRLTAPTAAALLALTMARADALPSPQVEASGDVSGTQHDAREFVPDFYHDVDDKEFQKREPHEGGGGGKGEGRGQWGGDGTGRPTGADGAAGNWESHTGWGGGQLRGGKPSGAPTGGQGEHGWGNGQGSHPMKRDDSSSTQVPGAHATSGLACRCLPSPDGKDVSKTGMPCVCVMDDGSDGFDPADSGPALDLSKRHKDRGGMLDLDGQWDWWQDQGSGDIELIVGNPNVKNIDFKFGAWEAMGGIKKRDDGDSFREPVRGGDKARPKLNHVLSES